MSGVRDIICWEGIVIVSDLVCGVVGMLIVYVECLFEVDINFLMYMFGSCIDIDLVVVDMVFIQLLLLGIVVEVVMGNMFMMQYWWVRYILVYYLNVFEK